MTATPKPQSGKAPVPVRRNTSMTTTPTEQVSGAATEPRLYRIPEAMRLLALSRSEIYVQLRERRLRSVHQGRARLIPSAAIADYIALLEREEAERGEAA